MPCVVHKSRRHVRNVLLLVLLGGAVGLVRWMMSADVSMNAAIAGIAGTFVSILALAVAVVDVFRSGAPDRRRKGGHADGLARSIAAQWNTEATDRGLRDRLHGRPVMPIAWTFARTPAVDGSHPDPSEAV